MMYESIIVGGGPAGLSAALILGRCLRNVLLCDNGQHRNIKSKELHAFLSRDNIPPTDFLEICRNDLKKYETVQIKNQEIITARKTPDGFMLTTKEGDIFQSRTLLIASGVMDDLPKIENFLEFYGHSIYNCPYCDAFEERGKLISVYGKSTRGFELAVSMKRYSDDVTLFTDGTELTAEEINKLQKLNIPVYTEEVASLEGTEKCVKFVVLKDGRKIKTESLFFNTGSFIRSKLLEQLDCPFTNSEGVFTDKYERTEVPGLFVAGNILREVQLVIVAAGQGAEAAFGIHKYLNRLS